MPECKKCGACCREVSTVAPLSELDWLIARGARIVQKNLNVVEGCWILPCPKLGPDGLCSDYEGRPATCRDFPGASVRLAYDRMGLQLMLPKGCSYA